MSKAEQNTEVKRRIPIYPGFPELERSDVSIYPTYSKLELTYCVVCRHRYHWNAVKYYKQFLSDLHMFEQLQYIALDSVRVHREFVQGILSHKIPPKRYIATLIKKLSPNEFTPKELLRIERIISAKR